MKERAARLTQGEWIVLIGGLLLIADLLLLPWYSLPLSDQDRETLESRGILVDLVDLTYTGVQSSTAGYGVAAVILTAVMIVQILLTRILRLHVPDPPVPWSQIHLILGIFVAVVLVIKFVKVTDFLGYGAYSAILAGILVAYGGYRIASEPNAPALPAQPEDRT